jgi:hypothetical protein
MSSWMGVRINNASTYNHLLQLAFGYRQTPTFASEHLAPEPRVSPTWPSTPWPIWTACQAGWESGSIMHRHTTSYFNLLSDIIKFQPLLLNNQLLSLAYLLLGGLYSCFMLGSMFMLKLHIFLCKIPDQPVNTLCMLATYRSLLSQPQSQVGDYLFFLI